MQIIDLNPMLGLCKECYDYSGVQIKNHDFITKQTIDYFVCQWGQRIKTTAHNPNENREVLVYDHFTGDNSCLKFIIKFKRKKINVFFTSI